MLLDLDHHVAYRQYYQGLHPRQARYGAAHFRQVWQPAATLFQAPTLFDQVRDTLVPRLTDGTHRNPDRRQLLERVAQAVHGGTPPSDQATLLALAMRGSRAERWAALAAQLGQSVPTSFRAYRFVEDTRPRTGMAFTRDVVHQWERGTQPFGVRHWPASAWSLLRSGALRLAQGRRSGVLYVAEIPFLDTFADILVDDATFISDWWNQAELLCLTPQANQLVGNGRRTQVLWNGQWYREEQWGSLATKLEASGIRL